MTSTHPLYTFNLQQIKYQFRSKSNVGTLRSGEVPHNRQERGQAITFTSRGSSFKSHVLSSLNTMDGACLAKKVVFYVKLPKSSQLTKSCQLNHEWRSRKKILSEVVWILLDVAHINCHSRTIPKPVGMCYRAP